MRLPRPALSLALALTLGCGESGSGGSARVGNSAGSAGSPAGGGGQSGGSAGSSTATGGAPGGRGGASSGGEGQGTGGNGGRSGEAGSPEGGGPTSGTGGGGSGGLGGAGTHEGAACAELPAPTGNVIEVNVDQADELPGIVREAPAGTTILLADGTYRMTGGSEAERRIQIVSDGVTLRGASGDRDAVVIDGEYETQEVITVVASDVTIAHLSVERAIDHLIHVTGAPDGDTTGIVLHDLHLVDGGEQFVKINTSGATPNTYTDDGTVSCSLFEMTDAGRPHVVPDPGGCYTGGIDGHQAQGWVVRDNAFVGIHCENGSLAEHAIHFWTASRDTLVERNTIIDCARGIGFGLGDGGGADPDCDYAANPYPGVGYVGHYDGTIRNNVIAITPGFEFFDTGIELEQALGARVLNNTVIHPDTAFASISHRFANSVVTLENNLVRTIRARDGSTATGNSNLEGASDALFADVAGHDLHLVSGATSAIDQGVVLPDVSDDIDGEPRADGKPDIGADER